MGEVSGSQACPIPLEIYTSHVGWLLLLGFYFGMGDVMRMECPDLRHGPSGMLWGVGRSLPT